MVKAGQQPTVSCGDIIIDSDCDDSVYVPMKTTTKQAFQLHSHEAFANVMGLVISVVWYLQAETGQNAMGINPSYLGQLLL